MPLYQKNEHKHDDSQLYHKPEHNNLHPLYQKDEPQRGKGQPPKPPQSMPPKSSPLEKPEPKPTDAPAEMANPKAPMGLQKK